jgi:hypothetical protein
MTIREATRAEIEITTPLTSRSGKWEISTGERDSTVYDDFWMMVDFLAAKFGEIESGAAADPTNGPQQGLSDSPC